MRENEEPCYSETEKVLKQKKRRLLGKKEKYTLHKISFKFHLILKGQ